ncbi:MAG: phosphoglucomutase/phosphomannomutase family protein [Acidobacteriia bacterium]|jgi:alpha-D-glucose phosphate-specific phosphoglucomutase|nr:phosphoglucomutase/phosphomannomutase family protein [Terriglobia bacterium]
MPSKRIRFGTSGWRAILADEFTFDNVRLAVAAIAGHVKARSRNPALIVGHDTRFLSEEFAQTAAGVLAAHHVRPLLCDGAAPTPTIAYEILRRKTDGAINFTASHNPADYHGLKFSGADGAPALPEVTREIEERFAQLAAAGRPVPEASHADFERIAPRQPYLERLSELVDLDAIRRAGLRVVCDPLHGAGSGYLDRILAEAGVAVTAIRTERDVLFDGLGPDVGERNLAPLREAVRRQQAHVGLATDGDADRFGVLDADGSFVQPNHILGLLLDYLLETRGWRLGVARSVATTHLLDAVARHHGVEVHQTPVGFKYIGELIRQGRVALGGEESAGMSIHGHVPEKDGILACLLVAEMMARRGSMPLAEQLRALFQKLGAEFWPQRENLAVPETVRAGLPERIRGNFSEFAGKKVIQTDRTDGIKLVFADGSWLLLRSSGTEPLVRIYAESSSPPETKRLIGTAKQWLLE